jgi:hypothetical protein
LNLWFPNSGIWPKKTFENKFPNPGILEFGAKFQNSGIWELKVFIGPNSGIWELGQIATFRNLGTWFLNFWFASYSP